MTTDTPQPPSNLQDLLLRTDVALDRLDALLRDALNRVNPWSEPMTATEVAAYEEHLRSEMQSVKQAAGDLIMESIEQTLNTSEFPTIQELQAERSSLLKEDAKLTAAAEAFVNRCYQLQDVTDSIIDDDTVASAAKVRTDVAPPQLMDTS